MKSLVYFMIAASLIGAGNFSLGFGPFQLSIYRGLLIVLFATVLIVDFKNNENSLRTSKENRYSVLFMTVWLVYAVLSLVWVKDVSAWFKAVFFLGSGFMGIIVFIYYLRSLNDILNAFRAFVPMILFHNMVGWYEWITGRYMFLPAALVPTYQRVRYPVSTFGNTNNLGLFLIFSCFILFVFFISSERKILRFSYIAGIGSSLLLLFFTKSRASLLGLMFGLVFLFILSVRRKVAGRVFLALSGLLLLAVIIKPDLITSVSNKINTLLTFDFSQQSGSEFVRINLIKNGLEFWMSTIGFGTGAGNIEYWMEHFAVYNVAAVYNIHNWWLEILVCFGIFIFTGYIVFYVKLLQSMWDRIRNSSEKVNAAMAVGIMSFMIAYIIASISASSNMNSEWLWVFWGIVIAYQGLRSQKTEEKKITDE